MDERRNEGLSKAIDDGSKGFKMLQALGYEPGKGLGRAKQGRATPVEIVVKRDRVGIGGVTPTPSKREESASASKRRRTEPSPAVPKVPHEQLAAAYRAERATRFEHSSDFRDVFNAVAAVVSLDERAEVGHNPLVCPACLASRLQARSCDEVCTQTPASDCTGEAERITKPELRALLDAAGPGPTVSTLLRELLDYLRSRHVYCLYCGCAFECEQEMCGKCPGSQRSEH